MAINTLLLCFIHGFKGDEETFYQFPDDLKTSLSTVNSDVTIETRVYPKYETRGDLALSVQTFKEWLQAQVISLETSSNNTQSAIHDPSVSVILVAHSMGGFVAADTLFSVLDNRPISNDPGLNLMFPLIQGVLAFDTPWNGLSRSMFAYGAFSQYQNISSAWNLLSTGTNFLTSAGAKTAVSSTAQNAAQNQLASQSAANNNSWTRWSALAARTGTYGAIMAGGVAAYIHRDQILQSLRGINRENLSKINYTNTKEAITSINYSEGISQGLTYVSRESIGEGFAWMASHLKFVGALMKTESLTTRLERLSEIEGVGVKCLYTSLGENGVWTGGYFVPKRTFCAIPTASGDEKAKEKGKKMEDLFVECPDIKAANEIVAHCGMFKKERNDNYDNMVKMATGLLAEWMTIDPRRVRDEWKPSGEQLQRTLSESKVWDDDGKVLKPPGGDGDEGQLDAILKSDEMPHGEDGGVDEKELMEKAAAIPLPVDEDVIGEGVLGDNIQGAETASKSIAAQGMDPAPASIQHAEQANTQETPVGEKSSDDEKPPLTEYEKPMKAEDNQLSEDMSKASSGEKSEVADNSQDIKTQDSKQVPADQTAKKSWLGMVPGISSSTTNSAAPETQASQAEQNKPDKDAPSQKTWMDMLPSVSSLSARSQDTTQNDGGQSAGDNIAETKTNEEDKSKPEQTAAPQKTWLGMLPSVPALSSKTRESSSKDANETKSTEENVSAEQPAEEARKKWFGVV